MANFQAETAVSPFSIHPGVSWESKGSEYFDLLITSLNLYSIKSPTVIKVPGLFYLVGGGSWSGGITI
jgi:hypothetical protein